MDEVGVETTIVFTGATGAAFDRQAELFKPHGKRFQVWCSLETSKSIRQTTPSARFANWSAATGKEREASGN